MTKHQHVGIDVSATELVVSISGIAAVENNLIFSNTPSGYQQLIKRLTKQNRTASVGLESTGVYSQPVALALHGIKALTVHVLNPRAVKDFARASMARAKTDKQDASLIREYILRMDVEPWEPPRQAVRELQALSRRIHQLKEEVRREDNRHKQSLIQGYTVVADDILINLQHLKARQAQLEQACLDLIEADDLLAGQHRLLHSIIGIGDRAAPALLAELATLPAGMKGKQWVAHAGLDPRPRESGSSLNKPRRITKTGNRYLRHALYMPALVAIRHSEHVRGFYEHLIAQGKKPKQAIVAVMRKLLLCIHGILKHGRRFEGSRFYRLPMPDAEKAEKLAASA